MKARVYLHLSLAVLLVVLGVAAGCSKAPNDAQISSDIQSKLSADSGLQGKQIAVSADKGTVTLSGSVDNDAQKEAASRYAASEPGVKQVLNNLSVGMAEAQAPPPAEESQPAPVASYKPRASAPRHRHTASASSSNAIAPDTTTSVASAAPVVAATPMTPPAPVTPAPPPPPQKVTVPSGTVLAVRLIDTLDTETAQPGQTFKATLESPLSVDGDVVVPAGYDVEGHVVDVKSAGKFAGKSELRLQLDRIQVGNKHYSVQTDQFFREGSSRGKNTAAKVGTGAAIGTIIGAIAGGGKGAAIGAAAGGGLGGGVQAATKGQQIKLASETVLNFTLQAPLSVLPTTKGPREARKLEANE